MLLSNPFGTPVVLFTAGVSLHSLLFRLGEWHLKINRLYLLYSIIQVVFICYLVIYDAHSVPGAIRTGIKFGFSHLLGIFSSMAIYRLFFHHLYRFPGPFIGRLSGLYLLFLLDGIFNYSRRWMSCIKSTGILYG